MPSAQPVRTICPYCGVGCGVLVAPVGDGRFAVTGDPDHPANLGRLCSKGAALGETLGTEGRLLHPEIAGRRVRWDEALDRIAGGLKEVIARHGPDAVAFYVSGQLLTEDYYVANKLMKGFIGSGNIDTNSRLCMSSSVAAYKRAFGADTVPCDYADLEQAELIVLVGSNTAWCHPVLYQRIRQARRERPGVRLVVIDPRRTATCEDADQHLALEPGTDTLLFNGLLDYLRREDALDWDFLERHTSGFADAFRQARDEARSIPAVAAGCGLPEAAVADFFRTFARTQRCVTLYSQGVNQWSFGTDKANAIINCHLATGRIGRPGMGPFSITGQPNAMGGREVGGLSNQLAAHMDFSPESVDLVSSFWGASQPARVPGLKAVDLFRAVEAGSVKAVWIMATNPAVSLPDADRVRAALRACNLVIVSDMTAHTDTAACADILLPAASWGEKDGTVTNSERRISRQRAFMAPPGEARPDWWILTQVARRLGFSAAFPYESAGEIFREHAALTALHNNGSRDLDLGGLADLDAAAYAALSPTLWPVPRNGVGSVRPFADGRFYTPDGKARFVAVSRRAPAFRRDEDYPLILNTGRVRDQWHTMTRTGRAARLNAHTPEPFVQIHPADAATYRVANGDLATVESRWGRMLARVVSDARQQRGSLFVPMHWSDAYARNARADAVVNPAVDPISGQPESKHTPVRVAPFAAAWHAFVLTREPIPAPSAEWCVRIAAQGHWRYELAGGVPILDLGVWAQDLLKGCAESVAGERRERLDFADPAGGRYRGALLENGRLVACVFAAPGPALPGRAWLGGLFALETLDPAIRAAILAGKPARGGHDAGETVCACFNVGFNTIRDAILEGRVLTVDGIGALLGAGTNCGSCLPELARMLDREGANALP